MEIFQKLGAEVERLWCDRDYNEEVFPEVAAEALHAANIPEKITAWDVMEWTLNETHLPEQRDLSASFGDPPITLYNSPRFYIDVYFWLQGTTSIHQHGFCGAFQVLLGSSIHSWYDFDLQEKINSHTEIGNINLKAVNLLTHGDIQQIYAGRRYIHGLFHLDHPSATIVVRTLNSPLELPQFDYRKPYLAINPFFHEPNMTRKTQCISSLLRLKNPDADRLIGDMLNKADFQTSYQLLLTVRGFLQQDKMEQMFNLNTGNERFDKCLEIVRNRHGEKANILPKLFAHQDRVNEILTRRSFVTDNEHRFFLALLMNIDGKKPILSLIKERFPDTDPVEKILDWSLDLSEMRVMGLNIPNALGIADFDQIDLFVLEAMLRDQSDEEMREKLKSEYPGENTDELTAGLAPRMEKIQKAVIFYPLFN